MNLVMTYLKYTKQHNNRVMLLIFVLCIAAVTCLFSSALFGQQDPTAEQIKSITANWVCKWCPYSDKNTASGSVTGGAGYISNDSFRHGDYTGLDEKGPYAIAAARYSGRTSEGNVIHAEAENLGLDSRNAEVEGGMQGTLYAKATYQQIPKLNSDTARTPYTGDSDFTLPAGWTTGTDTQNMPQLTGALHYDDIYTRRNIFSLQGMYYQNDSLSYQFAFERNIKSGSRTAGLALGNSFATARSIILAIPVDYVTNQGEIKLNYQQANWQAGVAYQFSKFNNGKHFITWENAFSEPTGVTKGQAALEPDNVMQKVLLNASYRFGPSTYTSALVALGRLEQDDTFLPYTVNASLAPPVLPASSLEGNVNTADATFNLYSKITPRFNLTAKLLHNEMDNNTDRHTYSYVTVDTSLNATPRANFPYSFRKEQAYLQGQYQIPNHDFSLGIRHTTFDRTYQEVDTTKDNVLNVAYKTALTGSTGLKVTGEHSKRDGAFYDVVSEVQPAENPILRKYNMANRKRNQLGISLDYSPGTRLDAGIYIDAAKDDYPDSDLGLQESMQKDYGFNLGYRFSPRLETAMDYSITTIASTQAGSQTYSTSTWLAKNNDRVDAVHLAVHYQWIPKTLKLAFEYEYARSTGETAVSTAVDFPVLRTERQTILLSGDYRLNKSSTLLAFFRYEHYDENDWAVDEVFANTIPNVLSLGEVSPSYNIGVIGVAVKYLF